jgi:hypothetical protein
MHCSTFLSSDTADAQSHVQTHGGTVAASAFRGAAIADTDPRNYVHDPLRSLLNIAVGQFTKDRQTSTSAGWNHVTNAALYRLAAGTDQFVYVGDARSASEAAANWKPGETAEKFHTRPTWHNGKV